MQINKEINQGIINNILNVKDDIGNEFTFDNNIVRTSGASNKCLLNAFFGAALLDNDRNIGVKDVDYGGNQTKQFALSHYDNASQHAVMQKILFQNNADKYKTFKQMFEDNLKDAEKNKVVTSTELLQHYSDNLIPQYTQEFTFKNNKFYNDQQALLLNDINYIDHVGTFRKIVEERQKDVIYKTILEYFVEISNDGDIKKLLGQEKDEQERALNNILQASTHDEMLEITSAGALLSHLSGKKINIFSKGHNNENIISVTHFDKGYEKLYEQHRQTKFKIQNKAIFKVVGDSSPVLAETTHREMVKIINDNEKTHFFKRLEYCHVLNKEKNTYKDELPDVNSAPLINPDDLKNGINADVSSNKRFMIDMSLNPFALPQNQTLISDKDTVNLLYGYGPNLQKSQHYQILTKPPSLTPANQPAKKIQHQSISKTPFTQPKLSIDNINISDAKDTFSSITKNGQEIGHIHIGHINISHNSVNTFSEQEDAEKLHNVAIDVLQKTAKSLNVTEQDMIKFVNEMKDQIAKHTDCGTQGADEGEKAGFTAWRKNIQAQGVHDNAMMDKFQKISAEIQKQTVGILNTRKGRRYNDDKKMMRSYRLIQLLDATKSFSLNGVAL